MNHRKLSRRQMLKVASLSTLAGSFLPRGLSAAEAATAGADKAATVLPQVPRRILGKTKQTVPILLQGGSMNFDQTFDPRFAECMRFGVNYFDMADCYAGGTSETALGSFLEKTGKRDGVWITTKSCNHEPDGLARVLQQSLDRMKTDQVELMFLHGLKDEAKLSPAMAAMADKLKKEGKTKFFGFSCHDKNVAELLQKAATLPWIDAIMFKYNFREYGNKELNDAMDACHKAGIGLIAMKTQGSAVSFDDKVKPFEGSKFTRGQAVLKAVWADERITAAVSKMDNLERVKENVAAALDKSVMDMADFRALENYAGATRHLYCAGCEQICGKALPDGVLVGTTLRYLMYHDTYEQPEVARGLFSALPEPARRFASLDFRAAEALCPNHVAIGDHMRRAAEVLA